MDILNQFLPPALMLFATGLLGAMFKRNLVTIFMCVEIMLCGATLGGNLTPIGASANIAGIGILRKEGHEVKATTFMKYGVPFTLAAVTTGYLLIWFIWKP